MTMIGDPREIPSLTSSTPLVPLVCPRAFLCPKRELCSRPPPSWEESYFFFSYFFFDFLVVQEPDYYGKGWSSLLSSSGSWLRDLCRIRCHVSWCPNLLFQWSYLWYFEWCQICKAFLIHCCSSCPEQDQSWYSSKIHFHGLSSTIYDLLSFEIPDLSYASRKANCLLGQARLQ